MKLAEFDYELPEELVAQYPVKDRAKCRLMVLDRASKSLSNRIFEDIVDYFNEGDCLILNDTKVIRARLLGRRKTGGRVEIFLLSKEPVSEALIRPSGRLKEGERIVLESGDEAEILHRGRIGRYVKFGRPPEDILNACGRVPLPPYIGRPDEESDRRDYQTVYALKEGATASPTAGLHFTKELFDKISAKGVEIAFVTLHTSYGTFAPIKTEDVESHKMHGEYFELLRETAELVKETKKIGKKVFAVGTTTTRVLEYCADHIFSDNRKPITDNLTGHTDMFIYPGYRFKVVDHLITNFHLPKSTLLLLVGAFAGTGYMFEAYREAVKEGYRFFSYGDAMLIL